MDGNGAGYSMALSIDTQDNLIVTGYTNSFDFPVTFNSNPILNGHKNFFVTKLNSSGDIVWSLLSGGELDDLSRGIGIDSSNNIIIFGFTTSNNFSKTTNDYVKNNKEDVFVHKYNPSGILKWSLVIGGNSTDHACGLTIDGNDGIIIMGGSTSVDFPTINANNETSNGKWNTLILYISSNGSIQISDYFGGSEFDVVGNIFSNDDRILLVGYSYSKNFPITNNSTINSGFSDGFISLFKSSFVNNAPQQTSEISDNGTTDTSTSNNVSAKIIGTSNQITNSSESKSNFYGIMIVFAVMFSRLIYYKKINR